MPANVAPRARRSDSRSSTRRALASFAATGMRSELGSAVSPLSDLALSMIARRIGRNVAQLEVARRRHRCFESAKLRRRRARALHSAVIFAPRSGARALESPRRRSVPRTIAPPEYPDPTDRRGDLLAARHPKLERRRRVDHRRRAVNRVDRIEHGAHLRRVLTGNTPAITNRPRSSVSPACAVPASATRPRGRGDDDAELSSCPRTDIGGFDQSASAPRVAKASAPPEAWTSLSRNSGPCPGSRPT